jgi:hypothetical protein
MIETRRLPRQHIPLELVDSLTITTLVDNVPPALITSWASVHHAGGARRSPSCAPIGIEPDPSFR